jgi:hypothetical protein
MSYSYSGAMIGLIDETLANLPVSVPSNQVDIPGNKFTTPDSGYWARLSFTTINSTQIPCWQRDEVIYAIDLFYPQGNGTIQQMNDAEALRSLLQNKKLGDASAHKAIINVLGNDGPWYHLQIQLTFTFEGQ